MLLSQVRTIYGLPEETNNLYQELLLPTSFYSQRINILQVNLISSSNCDYNFIPGVIIYHQRSIVFLACCSMAARRRRPLDDHHFRYYLRIAPLNSPLGSSLAFALATASTTARATAAHHGRGGGSR